jgi:hypothetical protein
MARPPVKPHALSGQHHAVVCRANKGVPVRVPGHTLRVSRLWQVQPPCGRPQAALVSDGHQVLQLLDLHGQGSGLAIQ